MKKTGDRLSLTSLWVDISAFSFVLSLLFQAPLFGQQNGNLCGTVNVSQVFPEWLGNGRFASRSGFHGDCSSINHLRSLQRGT